MTLEEALNPNTSSIRLQEILDFNNLPICLAIIKNPNTPPDLLIQLARYKKYFDKIGNNPNLELILIKNPNFLYDISYENFFTCHKFILNITIHRPEYFPLPNWFLELGLKAPNFEVRSLVIETGNLPISVLEKMAEDRHSRVRISGAGNITTPTSVLEKLAEDENNYVKMAVAKNPNTPISI